MEKLRYEPKNLFQNHVAASPSKIRSCLGKRGMYLSTDLISSKVHYCLIENKVKNHKIVWPITVVINYSVNLNYKEYVIPLYIL